MTFRRRIASALAATSLAVASLVGASGLAQAAPSITVDSTSLGATITVNGCDNYASIILSITGPDGTSDPGMVLDPSSPMMVFSTSEAGTYTANVRCLDYNGGSSDATASTTFTADATVPATSDLVLTPDKAGAGSVVQFTATSLEPGATGTLVLFSLADLANGKTTPTWIGPEVTVDASGTVIGSFTVPDLDPGMYLAAVLTGGTDPITATSASVGMFTLLVSATGVNAPGNGGSTSGGNTSGSNPSGGLPSTGN